MDRIIETLVKWIKEKKSYPTQLQFHLTNFCNLKCIFCPTRALVRSEDLKVEKELSTKEWLRILNEAIELGVQEFHICGGGEPFFFTQKCLLLMKKIKREGKYGEVITNGTFLKKEVCKEIVKLGWDKVYISLDAPKREVHDYLRGVECFDRIIRNVKWLVKFKQKFNARKPTIAFHMVVCKVNYKLIPEMISLANKLQVDEVLLNALNIWKPEIRRLKLSKKEEKELRRMLLKLDKDEKKVATNIIEFLKFKFYEVANLMDNTLKKEIKKTYKKSLLTSPCYYPWYNISIFADGTVQPCFIPQNVGENIKGKSLKEIWFGKTFNQFRKNLLKGNLTRYCSKCNPWNLPKMKEIRSKLGLALKKS